MNCRYDISYSYTNIWDDIISDNYYCETIEEARAFIKNLVENRNVYKLFLSYTEQLI